MAKVEENPILGFQLPTLLAEVMGHKNKDSPLCIHHANCGMPKAPVQFKQQHPTVKKSSP